MAIQEYWIAFDVQLPSRIRNSPTKPFRNGRPIDDKRRNHKQRGKPGHRCRQPAKVADQARVPAFVDEADKQKQRAGRDAVIEHLIERALHAQFSKREETEHDKAHVTD